MKVILAVIFAIGSASSLGSGPYLPSGWKPQGPAFYLPSEIQKPVDKPIKETLLFETEASGSEGLREYGPPKFDLNVVQGLPDVVTEQAFYVVDNSALVQQQKAAEVTLEQRAKVIQETAEAQVTEAVESKTQDLKIDEVSTAAYEAVTDQVEVVTDEVEVVTDQVEVVTDEVEVVTDQVEVVTDQVEVVTDRVEIVANIVEEDVVTDKANIVEVVSEVKEVEATVAAVQEKLKNIVIQEEQFENIVVKNEEKIEKVVGTIEGVRNIAEALNIIDNEINAEQKIQSTETTGELKVTQKGSESGQVPEGFLEYGPPGFREYGPPKEEDLQEYNLENEVRRRRFSPKFRPSKH